jgi:hypothetical protein
MLNINGRIMIHHDSEGYYSISDSEATISLHREDAEKMARAILEQENASEEGIFLSTDSMLDLSEDMRRIEEIASRWASR